MKTKIFLLAVRVLTAIANGCAWPFRRYARRQVVKRARKEARCQVTVENVKLPHDEAQSFIGWLGGCICGEPDCPNHAENSLSEMSETEFDYKENL
jgi:hypothetical protein